MRILRCPACERVAPMETIDSEIMDRSAFRCRSCLTTLETAQETLRIRSEASR